MAEILLTGVQDGLYPFWMVGRIGILLALEADTHVLGVGDAMLAGNILIGTDALEVTAIYLYARLVGKHLHEDACLR